MTETGRIITTFIIILTVLILPLLVFSWPLCSSLCGHWCGAATPVSLRTSPYSQQALLCNNKPWESLARETALQCRERQTTEYRHAVIWYWHIHYTVSGTHPHYRHVCTLFSAYIYCISAVKALDHWMCASTVYIILYTAPPGITSSFTLILHSAIPKGERASQVSSHVLVPGHIHPRKQPTVRGKPTLACTTPQGV